MTIKWGVGNITNPLDPELVITLYVNDGLPGDIATNVGLTTNNTFSGGCGSNTLVSSTITVIADFSCVNSVTSVTIVHRHQNDESGITPCVSTPDPPGPAGLSGSLLLYYWDETLLVWVQIPTPTWSISTSPISTTFNFPAVSTHLLRVVASTSYEVFYDAATISALVNVSDLRTVNTLLAPTLAPSVVVTPDCSAGLDVVIGTVACATSYEYRVNGGAWAAAPGASFNLPGLDIGFAYTVEARGVNTGGAGPSGSGTAIVDQGCGGGGGGGGGAVDDGSINPTSTILQDCVASSTMTKAAT